MFTFLFVHLIATNDCVNYDKYIADMMTTIR